MPKLIHSKFLMTALLVAGCSESNPRASEQPADPEVPVVSNSAPESTEQVKQAPVETAKADDIPENRFDGWVGKWTGPEGMFVDVKSLGKGKFQLKMQSDLDTKGTYTGNAEEHGIRFARNGGKFLLYRTNGDETGLKYLAGKKECLMVKSGEGYCRD